MFDLIILQEQPVSNLIFSHQWICWTCCWSQCLQQAKRWYNCPNTRYGNARNKFKWLKHSLVKTELDANACNREQQGRISPANDEDTHKNAPLAMCHSQGRRRWLCPSLQDRKCWRKPKAITIIMDHIGFGVWTIESNCNFPKKWKQYRVSRLARMSRTSQNDYS